MVDGNITHRSGRAAQVENAIADRDRTGVVVPGAGHVKGPVLDRYIAGVRPGKRERDRARVRRDRPMILKVCGRNESSARGLDSAVVLEAGSSEHERVWADVADQAM